MDSKQKAEELVNGIRQSDYGHPKVNMKRIASIWSGILDMEVTPEQVALCMAGLKLARLVHSPSHEDTQVDLMGYIAVLQRLLDPEDKPAPKWRIKGIDDGIIGKSYKPAQPWEPGPYELKSEDRPTITFTGDGVSEPYSFGVTKHTFHSEGCVDEGCGRKDDGLVLGVYADGSKDMTFEEAVGLPKPDPNTGAKNMHREVKPTKDLTPEETRVLIETGMYYYLIELNRLRGGNSCGQ